MAHANRPVSYMISMNGSYPTPSLSLTHIRAPAFIHVTHLYKMHRFPPTHSFAECNVLQLDTIVSEFLRFCHPCSLLHDTRCNPSTLLSFSVSDYKILYDTIVPRPLSSHHHQLTCRERVLNILHVAISISSFGPIHGAI